MVVPVQRDISRPMDESARVASKSQEPDAELNAALADLARPLNRIGLASFGMVLAAGLSLTLAILDTGSAVLAVAAFVWLVCYAA